jgi:hypothetical protein
LRRRSSIDGTQTQENAMTPQTLTQSHQSATGLAGTWKLAAGRAVTLRPREPGLLRIAHGSVWATGDGPHAGALNDQGDRFLEVGDQLTLRRGETLVIEAFDKRVPAYFSWDPLPQAEPRRAAAALAQPVEDLRLALVLGASAAGRLLAALAGLAWAALGRDRPSLVDRAFKAHSSA